MGRGGSAPLHPHKYWVPAFSDGLREAMRMVSRIEVASNALIETYIEGGLEAIREGEEGEGSYSTWT